MNNRVPPHNLAAEESLLGAMLLSRPVVGQVLELGMDASVFYKPSHQHIYATIRSLVRDGQNIDVITIADELRRNGLLDDIGGMDALTGLTVSTPSVSNGMRYAKIVQDTWVLRQMISVAGEITEIAYENPNDVTAALDEAEHKVRGIAFTGIDRWPVYQHPDDIPAQRRDDWVLHELFLPGEVGIVTAGGGSGKSTLLRQWAMCCENSLHPFTGAITSPTTGGHALVVDTETQSHGVKESFINMGNRLHKTLGIDVQFPAIISLRERLDLRSGPDLAELRRVVARERPRLVCMGPLKNLYMERDGEAYANAALDLQDRLMKIMTDFDCAIAMEAHGTKGDAGTTAGSQRWNDWPDIAFGLEPLTLDDVEEKMGKRKDPTLLNRKEEWVHSGNGRVGEGLIRLQMRRLNRNDLVRLPDALVRTPDQMLPWMTMDTYTHRHSTDKPATFRGNPAAPTPAGPKPQQGLLDDEPF